MCKKGKVTMKKIMIIAGVYILTVLLAYIYCQPDMPTVMIMFSTTIVSVLFTYSMVLMVKLLEFTGGARFFMRITKGIIAYFPYIMCFQLFMFAIGNIALIFGNKFFEGTSFILPRIICS